MSTAFAEIPALSMYDRIGGEEGVRTLVERFYDLMALDPAYTALRAIHAPDLFPTRVALTRFLCGWLGGPRDWFDQRQGTCIMSMHRAMQFDAPLAAQWVDAMRRAMIDTRVDRDLARQMLGAFIRMSGAMINREER
ncbi:group II truncated hemoglobin [Stakelama sediminis]|uniref:Hemoglobin n=1 Tax=Stakelama sediminis TaxID=463200 RepID=A0A840YW68_9SPHN|nr:group II truncated hemoglobin [Stakelama sediminis]MBB5717797.1 hemoglobin [Stakelama sediminis]